MPDRTLSLEGIYNLRDVGGYPTTDGQHVRWRRLLRSGRLHALSPSSQQALHDHGLRTIIDLRRPFELTLHPNAFAASEGITYLNLPLFDDIGAETVDAPAQTLAEVYIRYIELCQPQLSTVLSAIAEVSDAPLLVHCAVGKDRTGLVIALTLSALGVAPHIIADDYALSYAHLAPLFDAERPSIPPERRHRFERMIRSPREAMEQTLASINQRYGSVANYLETLGIGATQIERLRANLLE